MEKEIKKTFQSNLKIKIVAEDLYFGVYNNYVDF